MTAARRMGTACLLIVYAAPWAWVLCLGLLAWAVAVKVGHFPTYSNPDPKHVAGFSLLYEATVVLFFVALFSPLVVGVRAVASLLRWGKWRDGPLVSAAYLAGLALTGAVVFGDPFGLMTWLLD